MPKQVRGYVRFGSKADIQRRLTNVRFTPRVLGERALLQSEGNAI